jgi:hypothetical protein
MADIDYAAAADTAIKNISSSGGGSNGSGIGASAATGAAIGTVIPGVGNAIGAVVGTVLGAVSGLIKETAPMLSWNETNSIADPMAHKLTDQVILQVGASNVPAVFATYSQNLIGYIKNSAHASAETDNTYVTAIQNEAIDMGGGFRDMYDYGNQAQAQLAYCLWLHAMWFFGNIATDQIKSGFGASAFTESLTPTLIASVAAATGQTVTLESNPVTPANAGVKPPATVAKASVFSNPLVMLAFAGAAIFVLLQFGKGK